MKIRNMELVAGVANICIPITSYTKQDILNEIVEIKKTKANVVEWRCDFYENHQDPLMVVKLLKEMRVLLKETPLIFTFRTQKEGGEATITMSQYLLLYKSVLMSKTVDMIDVELFGNETIIANLKKHANMVGCKLILSNHDFNSTPPTDKIIARMKRMELEGADIAKVAYMPKMESDVNQVIEALQAFQKQKALVIGISMGELGKKTRLNAGVLGSCITFASVKSESAPGQVNIKDM